MRISQASFERLSISSNNGSIYFWLLLPRLIKSIQVTLIHNPDAGDGFLDIVLVSKDERDNLNECLSHCLEGRLVQPTLTIRKGQQLRIEWDGSTAHIDDEVWPDKGSEFPLSVGVIEVTVKRGALQFLAAA
jgi:hypothetical protein